MRLIGEQIDVTASNLPVEV